MVYIQKNSPLKQLEEDDKKRTQVENGFGHRTTSGSAPDTPAPNTPSDSPTPESPPTTESKKVTMTNVEDKSEDKKPRREDRKKKRADIQDIKTKHKIKKLQGKLNN